ncbi:unnamed protein product [Brassica oleracea]
MKGNKVKVTGKGIMIVMRRRREGRKSPDYQDIVMDSRSSRAGPDGDVFKSYVAWKHQIRALTFQFCGARREWVCAFLFLCTWKRLVCCLLVQDGAVRLKKQALGTTRKIFQHLRMKGFGWMTHHREIYPLTIKPT